MAAAAAIGRDGSGPAGPEALLAIRNLSKTFGGVRALDRVDLTVAPGEIHGLLGTNGSGKSTLIKVLAGVHAPDPGAHLTLKGRDVELPLHAGEFRKLGLSFVHQNLGLIPALSVLEKVTNLRIGRDPSLANVRGPVDVRTDKTTKEETMRAVTQALRDQLNVVLETNPDGSVLAKAGPPR